ncbi:hypothetical protein [Flavobacterium sp. '19STA2R22 D10 B1']|uniref:hypothetical protein n=1 Tax=Flavobacterium aerium TaxID=3037261 RepID=UPI00278BEE06|nr:hypothetical protein [Flavobacterium sp. '19STA2R22 D10 B1']
MANLQWYPINPLLKEDGSFYALSFDDNAEELKPVALTGNDNPFAQFRVLQSSINLQTAASLGVALGSGKGAYKSFFLSYEAMLFTEKISTQPIGGKIYGTRWGAGLRVILKISDVQANASFNFGMIAAASELGLANVEYEINGIGINNPAILEVLPGPGQFNFDNYTKILNAADEIRKYMAKNPGQLRAEPFQVFISDELESDVLKDSQAVIFAANQLRDRKTIGEAIIEAKGRYDIDIIKMFYAKMGILDQNLKPTREHKNQAESYLNV